MSEEAKHDSNKRKSQDEPDNVPDDTDHILKRVKTNGPVHPALKYEDLPEHMNEGFVDVAMRYARSGVFYVKSWGKTYPVLSAMFAILDPKTEEVDEWDEDVPYDKTKYEGGWMIGTIEENKYQEWWVPEKEYVRPRVMDKYEDNVDLDKRRVNMEVVDLFKKYERKDRHVVYLDSPCGHTTWNLSALLGIPKDRLNIPNIDPNFGKLCHEVVKTCATTFESSIYEFMRDDGSNEVYDVLLDYCCHFGGNKGCRPQCDIEMILCRRKLAFHNGILWITCFSGRGFDTDDEEVCDFVTEKGNTYGYNIESIGGGSYGHMRYYFFRTVQL